MKCKYRTSYFLLVLSSVWVCTKNQAAVQDTDDQRGSDSDKIPLPDPYCSTEDEACQDDQIALDAIKTLHKQIDDDISGYIDVSESQEFFRDELQNTDNERQSIFHGNDDKISVPDLWNAWKKSKVYNWTVEDVVEWLISSVELPQYAQVFKDKQLNGSNLPSFIVAASAPIHAFLEVILPILLTIIFQSHWLLSHDIIMETMVSGETGTNPVALTIINPGLAVNSKNYISKDLGIKNTVHKHKLLLKAMDVVLFGPTKRPHNFLKDIALVTSIVVAMLGCWFAYKQNKSSKTQLKKMMVDLESLQKAEESLCQLQEKLQKAEATQHEAIEQKQELEQKFRSEIDNAKLEAERLKVERQAVDLEESRLELAEKELEQVRAALRQAEKELESRFYWGAPTELQQWLQYTFELEQQHFTVKQQAAQRQFGQAKEACEKMRRKRTGMLGTLRMAQGNSIDDIDQRILEARMALEEVRHDLQERQNRWQAIETFCGFPIRTNPGIAKLEHVLYGETGSLSGSTSTARLATSMVAPLNVEEADEDFPPQYTAATAMLFATKPNGCTRTPSTYSASPYGDYLTPFGPLRQSVSATQLNGPNSQGIGTSLTDMKRRPINMGSTSSLCKVPSQSVVGGKRDSLDSIIKSANTNSNGSHSSLPVSFHLGSHSPVSSPESPGSDIVFPLESSPSPDESKQLPKFRTVTGVTVQNGTRIPKLASVTESNLSNQRSISDGNLQKRILTKQVTNVVGSVPDDESLSSTESTDSDGRRKEKRKLKLIPKFMRKTEH